LAVILALGELLWRVGEACRVSNLAVERNEFPESRYPSDFACARRERTFGRDHICGIGLRRRRGGARRQR
jgi:hypothetical protein